MAEKSIPGLLQRIAVRKETPDELVSGRLPVEQIVDSVQYLASEEASASMRLDAYWPKWNSPWWHMMLLYEMDLTDRIPCQSIEAMVNCLKNNYLHFFPFSETEVPAGKDPIGDVMCHCQVGCAYQFLLSAGFAVDVELPWLRKWLVQYQLPDGGCNCNESAYTKAIPRSSVVSTLPVLEALLSIAAGGGASEEELRVLDGGAEYLLKRRLFRSISRGGAIIDETWTKLAFPRYYEYDLLRGLSFVVSWSLLRERALPFEAIEEALVLLDAKAGEEQVLMVERQIFAGRKTRIRQGDGSWLNVQDSSVFPLLISTSSIGAVSPNLTRSWRNLVADLSKLTDAGLV